MPWELNCTFCFNPTPFLRVSGSFLFSYKCVFTQTQKRKKNNRKFRKTVGNKLEWTLWPYVQGPSSTRHKYIRRKSLQQGKINKTKIIFFSKLSQHYCLSDVQQGMINKLWWNEAIHWNERERFNNMFLTPILLIACWSHNLGSVLIFIGFL